MRDAFGRTIEYLRISVTERCNFRCVYCAPNGHKVTNERPLTVAQFEQVVRASVALDITKFRLTGGEPLMRRDIVEIVRAINSVPGVSDVSLTTNASLLARVARPLAEAGVQRVNISLDTLRRDRFQELVGQDAFRRVWNGIEAAEQVGLAPLKINVVALKGVNDDEVADFGQMTLSRGWHVRFIELMPVGSSEAAHAYFEKHFIPASDLAAKLEGLEPVASPRGNGPARTFRLPGARGTIGFITPASQHFCQSCNRIRLTAEGQFRSCLFGSNGAHETALLADAHTQSQVQDQLRRAIEAKPESHPFGGGFQIVAEAMSEIGG